MRALRESYVVSFARVALALLLALVALLSMALGRTELSLWGWSWCGLALGLAVQVAPTRLRARYGWRVELPAFVLVLLSTARIALYGASESASLITIDADGHISGSARWVDRLFEERDASIVGSRLLVAMGLVPAPEFPTLPALLIASYPEHETFAPRLGTPVLSTLMGLDTLSATNAILVPGADTRPSLGVVFLHGSAGSFAFQCLEVAASLRGADAEVLCPSDHLEGRWTSLDAQRIVRSSVALLRARGAERIVLIGLSNGAIGASQIAHRFPIDGLVLISGVSSRAPSPRVRALVLQGQADAMVRTSSVRAWVRSHRNVHYVELPGTHFVLIEDRERVRRAIRAYCTLSTHRRARS